MRTMLPLLLLCASASTFAADPEVERLADDCVRCHAPQNVKGEMPMLQGQNARYLRAQLRGFKAQHRKAFPMDVIASTLPDEQVEAVSRALARRDWIDYPGPLDANLVRQGEALATASSCALCHAVDFRASDAVPRLAGQNPHYLARQLRHFGTSERAHPLPDGIGHKLWTETQVEQLAQFFASLRDEAANAAAEQAGDGP